MRVRSSLRLPEGGGGPPGDEKKSVALKVNEIFYSIQGESSFAGLPCVFVRLTGCNLRCAYCDTRYAYGEGRLMEIDEVLSRVAAYGGRLVEVTGGEPLIQEETPLLIERLLQAGCRVLLETNGSCDIGRVDPRCVRIVDVKCPSSGMAETNDLKNLTRLTENDELKFVVGDRDDYAFARKIMNALPEAGAGCTVNIGPVFDKLAPKTLAEWMLADRLNARLNLQLHKWVWGPDATGV